MLSYLADRRQEDTSAGTKGWDNVAVFHELEGILGHNANEGNSRTGRKVIYIE